MVRGFEQEARLRIGQLAELAGVEVATLRSWEARYGVPRPERTPGGQRRYPSSESARVIAMRRMVEAGYRPAEAARVVSATLVPERPASPDGTRDDLIALLINGDLEALRVLDRLVAGTALEDVLLDIVAPVLRELGTRWAERSIGVAEEHAASALVSSWLGAQIRALPDPMHPTFIVTATPPGERHELGLLIFTILLRRQGLRVLHLGADVPAEELARTTMEKKPALVCLSISGPPALDGLNEALEHLDKVHADGAAVPIALGGPREISGAFADKVTLLPTDLREAAGIVIDLARP